jgi:hypothetical protein
MKKFLFLFVSWSVLLVLHAYGQVTLPSDFAVKVTAEVQSTPPQIRLVWPQGRFTTSYVVSRKHPNESAWTRLAELPGNATQYLDTAVTAGHGYEYQLRAPTTRGRPAFGYIYAGSELPLVDQRGKILLIVDAAHSEHLDSELARLKEDLIGDGWEVLRADVPSSMPHQDVRRIIKATYESDPNRVKAVLLIGNIDAAYSGNISPDDHKHQGAWPADVYYADMSDFQWTDITINSAVAERQVNKNFPGDGKYDQSYPPGGATLQVGRIDFSNLPVFAQGQRPRSELDLLRQYLNKNHQFRHGQMVVERRGLMADYLPKGHIADTTLGDGDPVGNSGWRNFSAFFGSDKVTEIPENTYFNETSSRSYLWSFGAASGREFTSLGGIGSSADFAARDVDVVFTMFTGGFFGDWKIENNFLRSALGSGKILTATYSGLPHWLFHHMALGENIGFSTVLTQNNRRNGIYPPINDGAGQVHLTLLGDPTLRMHPVAPPTNLRAQAGTGRQFTWDASPTQGLRGYHIYRAASPSGSFQRLTGNTPVSQRTFQDPNPLSGPATYMVRAVKLEESASGTYYNASQGIMITYDTSTTPLPPASLQARALAHSQVLLTWNDAGPNATGFEIQRRTGQQEFASVAVVQPGVTAYLDRNLSGGTAYSYRIRALGAGTASAFSSAAEISTPPASLPPVEARAQFVQSDTQTRGAWTGVYGSEGRYVIAKEDRVLHAAPAFWGVDPVIPGYVDLRHSGRQNFVWAEWSTDPRALQRKPGWHERTLAVWVAPEKFSVHMGFTDTQPHRVSLYLLDWDAQNRTQTVEIFNKDGQLLDSRTVSAFRDGVYLTWDVQGDVRFDFTKVAGPNAILNGIFFDPAGSIPGTNTHTVTISAANPDRGTVTGGGTFQAGQSVTVTATPNAGFTFVNWTEGGAAVSTSQAYTFTANANRNLVANFSPATTGTNVTVTVSPNPAAGGTASGGGTVQAGQSVTVTATPNAGFNFVNWTEGGTAVGTTAAFTFTANANRNLVANFSPITTGTNVTVNVSANPAAGGTVSGGGTVQAGQSVTVTATPNAGFNFVNWTEGGTAVGTTAALTFTANANRNLVANFSQEATGTNVVVTVSASPPAGGTVTGGGTVAPGTEVTVTATANEGFTFVEWREGTAVVSTSPSVTFPATIHRTLVAVFSGGPATAGEITLLWQHTSGALALWTLEDGRLVEGVALQGLPQPGPEWVVVGTADFDNDGHADILWQHIGTGRLAVWYMTGLQLRQATLLTSLPSTGPGWRVVGLEDFTGDGELDLLWHHVDGWLGLWRMQGLTMVNAALLQNLPLAGREWRVAAVEDLNGDGQPDLLWQHQSGALAIWRMQGLQLGQAVMVQGAPIPGAHWHVVGTRPVGDETELLWMHDSGALATWRLQGQAFRTGRVLTGLPTVPPGWRVVQAGN